MPISPREAREAGREAVAGARRRVAVRVIEFLRDHDPDLLANLAEIGVVRLEWLEKGAGPMSTATPAEVVERLLERSVERRPSLLATMGLTAIQLLSSPGDDEGRGGVPARLAVVFTDLEGFTTFTAKTGDEAAIELLAEHHRAVGPIVRSRGGRIVKRLGDGLLLTFPEAEAAVLAGLELVDAEPTPLALRAGMHVGDVIVTREDVVGHVVNVAARVTEAARGGEVLATVPVRDAVVDHLPQVAFGRSRRRRFRGIDEPVGVSRARWA